MRDFKGYVLIRALALGFLLSSLSCKQQEVSNEPALYDRLGGKEAITAIVDSFVARIATDSRIRHFFINTDKVQMKECLVDQICEASGGPCEYKCRSMKVAHVGFGIGTREFNVFVEDLKITLDKFKIKSKEKKELMELLVPMKEEVLEKP